MKKSVITTLCGMLAIALSACQAKTGETVQETVEPSEAPTTQDNCLTYKNADFGYELQLPAGFSPQNDDEQMEKRRGGKLFIDGDGNMIDTNADKMDYAHITPEESAKQCYDFACAAYESNEKSELISKEFDGKTFKVVAKDEYGYRAQIFVGTPNSHIIVHFTYNEDLKDKFDKDLDEVAKSLKVE